MNKNRENGNTKLFTMRHIPPQLHRRWKTRAANLGVSMEDFARAAIEKALDVLDVKKEEKEGVNENEKTDFPLS